jgi:hypothetical protein
VETESVVIVCLRIALFSYNTYAIIAQRVLISVMIAFA